MPKLSIIVPVYNLEDYLGKCLESVMNQDTGNVEVLILDDGSTDGSWKLCKEYSERYHNVKAYHKPNEGLSATRNYGIKMAEGEYILFLDGDDFLTSDAIENILNELEQNIPIDVLIGRYISYYASTNIQEECNYYLDKEVVRNSCKEALLEEILTGKTYDWYACLNIVRKEFITKNTLYFKEGVCFEDALWTPELLFSAEKVSYLERPFYVYLQNRRGSITASVDEGVYRDKLYVCEYAEEFCRKHKLSKELRRKFMGNYNSIYVSLLADSWRLNGETRKRSWRQLERYRKILLYSERSYQTCLYQLWKILGIGGVSYVLHLRAEWVRKNT